MLFLFNDTVLSEAASDVPVGHNASANTNGKKLFFFGLMPTLVELETRERGGGDKYVITNIKEKKTRAATGQLLPV